LQKQNRYHLVNHAWLQSFGRKEVAAKAVSARGWGPLKYVLLHSAKLKEFAETSLSDTQSGSTTISSSVAPVPPPVDLGGQVTTMLLDQLLQDKGFAEGRKRKWEETKKKDEQQRWQA
jgi:hypothetical protein